MDDRPILRDFQSSPLLSPSLGWEHFVAGSDLWHWWQTARKQAITAHIPPYELDWFLQALAQVDRLALRLETISDQPQIRLKLPFAELTALWQQRLNDRVPVQYLVGCAPWRQFELQVSPAVLIPRPETECLIDLAAANAPICPTSPPSHWADLGTGSGAIALGLATAFPDATIHAVDTSTAALTIAQANAARYGLSDRIQFYPGSWFQPLTHLHGKLSGIVANPPYIPSHLVPDLQPEVSQHEPHLALDGGSDGLTCVRHLITAAPDYLVSGGIWLVELMSGQAPIVAELLQHHGAYTAIAIHPDLSGIDRFVLAQRQ